MAEVRVDDLDGSLASHQLVIGFDGDFRGLDLSGENARKFFDLVSEFWGAAQPVSVERLQATRAAAIRKWAADNGVKISPVGRIPQAVIEQFQRAMEV